MSTNIKEEYLSTSPEPITLKGTEKIIEQMKYSICRIYNNGQGTGFFVKIPYKSNLLLPVLITSNRVINKDDILNNRKVSLKINNDEIIKIHLENNRLIYMNEILDITIIEIKKNKDKLNIKYLELDDEIINYFTLNKKEAQNYSNESIYLLNFSKNEDIFVSYGKLIDINNIQIINKCHIKEESIGSPIFLMKNQKLIGIHNSFDENHRFNKGTLLIYSIFEFSNIKKNLLVINKDGSRFSS